MTPQEYVKSITEKFQEMNRLLLISNDDYIQTSSPRHHQASRHLWNLVNESGDVYKGVYSGWYNVREECFVSDSEAKEMNYVDVTSGKPLLHMNEEVCVCV